MEKLLEDVAEFHRACDVPISEVARWPSADRIRLRCDLIHEEEAEFSQACYDRDMVGAADALADLIYVAVGAALELGIPLAEVWDEVHWSNMMKVDQATGKVRRREDGKVLKPVDWAPPNLVAIISKAMTTPAPAPRDEPHGRG